MLIEISKVVAAHSTTIPVILLRVIWRKTAMEYAGGKLYFGVGLVQFGESNYSDFRQDAEPE